MSTLIEDYKARLVRDISRSVDELVDSNAITDFSDDARDATVKSALAGVREANHLNDRLGAFYTLERVMTLFGGVSRQAVNDRVKKHRLLRVQTSDGMFLFPAFQFEGAELRPHLAALLQVLLASGEDPWTVAYWLTVQLDEFEERTALEVVDSREADRIDELLDLAREDAASWHNALYGQITEHAEGAERNR
ncbi:hypothetical protein C5C13_15085 [Clavibacter michiganensis]|nr:hypothetical protein C5C13_15085 [Clavibacter michiganensis]